MADNNTSPYQQPVAEAILCLAEDYIRRNGLEGVYHYVHDLLGGGYHFSAAAITKWLPKQNGWPKRRQEALEVFQNTRAADALPPDDPNIRRLERQVKDQQQALNVLRTQLDEADARKTVVESLTNILKEEVSAWEPQPLQLPAPKQDQFPVDAVLALSDEHGDEEVTAAATWGLERFNYDVFRIRLERWTKVAAAYLTQHLPRYNFERAWIFKLGDSTHGNLHLAGQKYRNHFGNDLRAAIAVGEAEADAIARLLQCVPQVSLVSVSGNHPRQTPKKDYDDPHDNLDFLVATIIGLRLKNYIDAGRLSVHAPRSWSAYVDVRGRVNALNHGDDVQGTWGIPWYGFSKSEGRVQSLVRRKNANVDYFWYGHYHTPLAKDENGATSYHNGAFTLTSGYSINKVKSANDPTQLMKVMDDELGCILEIPLKVRDPGREALYYQGQYEPTLGRESSLTALAAADELAEKGEFPLIKAG